MSRVPHTGELGVLGPETAKQKQGQEAVKEEEERVKGQGGGEARRKNFLFTLKVKLRGKKKERETKSLCSLSFVNVNLAILENYRARDALGQRQDSRPKPTHTRRRKNNTANSPLVSD